MAKAGLADFDYPAGRGALADAYAAKGLAALGTSPASADAKALFELALATDPGCADAHYGRATLLEGDASRGKPELLAEAEREVRLALAREPTHAGAQAALARLTRRSARAGLPLGHSGTTSCRRRSNEFLLLGVLGALAVQSS